MITHIVLFKLKDGVDRDARQVTEAVELAREVGRHVPELVDWRTGWNTVDRDIAYDFAAIGVLADLVALQRYQENAFHRAAIEKWRLISDWVVADLADPD
ncbi:Dabb family protein [Salinispora tropica]|uniref:Stress responsive alpha-beta barrel domain protein n=1 Tax=Salinispora tropica (strain ATCC BAA-916 / DSM 44818 / JCM 13857 / NBRC 105044 / CNB-440) TaxID=369723 RepID=A4X3R1_SALTO|nr:Dabb family protein [Salinispora tropica]ABP53511.1 Stress responsive alpha-beta barrel domain protein [Salinispora tropica CNB-440]